MTHALCHIEGLPVIRCQYEKLLANPEAETTALHTALAAHFPTLKRPTTHSLNPHLVRACPERITPSNAQQTLYGRLVQSL